MYSLKWLVQGVTFRAICNTRAEAHFIYSSIMDTGLVQKDSFHVYIDGAEMDKHSGFMKTIIQVATEAKPKVTGESEAVKGFCTCYSLWEGRHFAHCKCECHITGIPFVQHEN